MRLFLYAGKDIHSQRLKNRMDQLASKQALECFTTIDSFSRLLRQVPTGTGLAIVYSGCEEEFRKIFEIGDLLRVVKTILILPNRKPELISAALKLHPRYISYSDGDFLDVSLVATRMLERDHERAN